MDINTKRPASIIEMVMNVLKEVVLRRTGRATTIGGGRLALVKGAKGKRMTG